MVQDPRSVARYRKVDRIYQLDQLVILGTFFLGSLTMAFSLSGLLPTISQASKKTI